MFHEVSTRGIDLVLLDHLPCVQKASARNIERRDGLATDVPIFSNGHVAIIYLSIPGPPSICSVVRRLRGQNEPAQGMATADRAGVIRGDPAAIPDQQKHEEESVKRKRRRLGRRGAILLFDSSDLRISGEIWPVTLCDRARRQGPLSPRPRDQWTFPAELH